MAYRHLTLQKSRHIVTCTLSNPPSHTLNAAVVRELHQMLSELETDASVRVLIFTGGGDGVFIAHYEVAELADMAETGNGLPDHMSSGQGELHAVHRLFLRFEQLPAITIAALNGNAAGGGAEFALACDFRLMADGPYFFGMPQTNVGITPGAGGTQRLARLIGVARTLDLVLLGTMLRPQRALELGLLHRLYTEAEFRERLAIFAARLAGRSPIALAAAKQAIHQGASLPMQQGLAYEQQAFTHTMRSQDAAKAMRAWLRGESYEWTGK